MTMLSQILTNTPLWVFGLFFALLALGIVQIRPRKAPMRRIIISPVVFLILSFMGVITAFGFSPVPLLAWLSGYFLAAYLIKQASSNTGNSFNAATRTFQLAGSNVPLMLMLSIFFVKYFVGASTGMHASYTLHPHFPVVVSLLYGVLSGAFAGRAWKLLQLVNPK
jgi:hypothetical protein